ncbi:MAG: beta-N-acetylhexosaminidase, partial [Anaerolineae bacterium]|nr:beta-N-acetylhexosaminidase [Anaerolineae bacterium]
MNTLEQQVGAMLGVGFEGLTPPDYVLDWLRAERVGAIVLFARNVASPAQLIELTTALREASPRPLLIAVDQE